MDQEEKKKAQVRSGDVEPGGTTAVARGPGRALPRPGRGLALPAATWHRTGSQGSIVQAWPSNPEQGRDSCTHQQAPFSRQTSGKLPLLLRLSLLRDIGTLKQPGKQFTIAPVYFNVQLGNYLLFFCPPTLLFIQISTRCAVIARHSAKGDFLVCLNCFFSHSLSQTIAFNHYPEYR